MSENIENENKPRRQRRDPEVRLRERQKNFEDLGTKRTNAVLEGLRKLGNLANKGNYEYSPEDVEDIFSVIERETRRIKRLFEPGVSNDRSFSVTESRTHRDERNEHGNKP